MPQPKTATDRVVTAAERLGLAIAVRDMPVSTRTAVEAAEAVGCDVGQIVKSLIFRGRETSTPYLLLVSGANRVNEKGVAADIGEKLKRPDADDVRALTGYAIGGIPPFGHAMKIKTFIDRDLLAHAEIWAAAGTPKSMFSIAPADLQTATGAVEITVT